MVDQFTAEPEPEWDWQKQQGQQFDIGAVINRAFDMLRRNFVPFFVTALVVLGIPAVLTFLLGAGALVGLESDNGAGSALGVASGLGAGLAVITLIVSTVILPAAIIYAALQGWAGQAVSMRASFRLMFGRFWSLLGLGIVAGFGITLGLLLLVVPGIILYCGWFVIIPVLIMERAGVFDSLSRSWDLTSGNKWRVFAIIVVSVGIQWVIAAVFSALTIADAFETMQTGESATGMGSVIIQLLSLIGDGIAQLINALLVASTYFELRRIKEGIGAGAIASIFD